MTQRLIRQSKSVTNWSELEGKPVVFPSNWASVADKPTSFATTWETITGKPLTFASEWSTLANKPATFASTWDLVTGKPTSFATTWALVAGKPTTFDPTIEYGVWTPSLAGTITRGNHIYTSTERNGWYAKIGRAIQFWFGIAVVNKDTAMDGNIFIDGLPFNHSNAVNSTAAASSSGHNALIYPTGYSEFTMVGVKNTNRYDLRFAGTGQTQVICTAANVGTNPIIRGSGYYLTD
ncbi:hypothetical protein [Microcoleus sp. FACHB-672]|uniref:hypothetical protein n=1 Tax=Microcoleus sp. FACHB-672 TaxID=2692825 RepID=UPI00168A2BF3|nr:hypothetical protein [Microcoleus sp. FACHB-672]MBD2039708.1 hypothetical protein [Microcoleus sp. FACHB-672]